VVDLEKADNALAIAWEDGARTRYPGAQLRWACPCAECRGEAGSSGRLDALADLPADELVVTDVALVGQYALALSFASGHATGIYTFRYLRQLGEPAS
jgi:DUF971 family protein